MEKPLFGRTTRDLDLPGRGIFAVVKAGGRLILKETIGDIPLSEGDMLVLSRRVD